MVSYPIYTVDAFTTEPFKGNPAAIVLLPYNNDVTDAVRQKLAAEMNISETAYITPIDEKETFEHGSKFNLRWFTPIMEVPLCGHATLASATVLFKCVGNGSEALYFETLSGTLVVKQGTDGKFIMDFPYGEPKPQDAAEFEEFVKISVGDLPYGDIAFSDSGKLMIRLGDNVTRQQLESLDPSPKLLIEAKNENVKGVIVTLKGNGAQNGCVGPKGVPYDFLSRCFAPRLGIDEDPVTGSAHTVLGPYWSNQLGKKELFACQCSKRSGELWLNVRDDRRVEISGFGYVNVQGTVVVLP